MNWRKILTIGVSWGIISDILFILFILFLADFSANLFNWLFPIFCFPTFIPIVFLEHFALSDPAVVGQIIFALPLSILFGVIFAIIIVWVYDKVRKK